MIKERKRGRSITFLQFEYDKFTDDDDGDDDDDNDDDENDDDDDDDKEVSLTEWVPSLSLTDRLLMSCLHQTLIKLSLIYDAPDDDDDDEAADDDDEFDDDHHFHHR